MEKYILQILENNSRVIVPEFGAFIIKQKNPLTIVFNEFLQYNDGVLVDAIAKNEGTDRDSAKKKIDEFVKGINSQLDKGDPFIVEQLGVLIKSSTGKISLEKDLADKPGKVADTKKTEKKPVQTKSTDKTSEKPDGEIKKETADKKSTREQKKEETKKPEEIKEQVVDKNKKDTEIPKEKPKEVKQEKNEKKEEEKDTPKQASKEPVESTSDKVSPKKEESKPQIKATISKKSPVVNTPTPKTSEPKTKRSGHYTPRSAVPVKERKRKTNVWLWVILILIVNGVIITYFIMSDQLGGLFKKPVELPAEDYHDMTIEPEEEQASDIIIIEPEEQIIEKEPITPAPKKQPVVTGKRYYVVAGVFREEQNADNLIIELRNQGYNSEKFGKIGSLHAVSYGVYTSKSEAEHEMKRIKQEVDPEAWIKVMH